MNILLTGSCGYIGSELTLCLLRRGHDIIAVDSLFYSQGISQIPTLPYKICYDNSTAGTYNFIQHDCRDWTKVEKLVKIADVIIPLAALVGMPVCDKYPKIAKEINQDSITKLVKLLSPSQRLIILNSNSCYGNNAGISTEKSPTNCLSHYAKTKYEAEQIALNSHENCVAFRLATVFGASSSRPRLDLIVNDWAYQAYFNKQLTIYNENYRRNYVHISDVVLGIHWAIENGEKGEIYNLGNDKENKTKLELAQQIQKAIPFELEYGEGEDKDKRDYIVSSEKLKKAGFSAYHSINEGLAELKEYFNYLPRNKRIREQMLKYNRNF